jgi:hypothetical protein
MPFLLILGVGAVVGVAGYLAAHGIAHVLRHYGVEWPIFREMDGPITTRGTLTALAAGAVALPAVLYGAALLGPALGVQFLPGAIGGATGTIAAVGGELVDHVHGKAPPTTAPKPSAILRPRTNEPDQPRQAPAPVPTAIPHDVGPGETLSRIADDNDVSLDELERANKWIGERTPPEAFKSPWDYVLVGETVAIPVMTPGAARALDKVAEPDR